MASLQAVISPGPSVPAGSLGTAASIGRRSEYDGRWPSLWWAAKALRAGPRRKSAARASPRQELAVHRAGFCRARAVQARPPEGCRSPRERSFAPGSHIAASVATLAAPMGEP